MLKGHLNWGPCPDIHVVNGESWPYPIGSMVLLYMVTFTINIPQMLACIYIYIIHGYYGYVGHIKPRRMMEVLRFFWVSPSDPCPSFRDMMFMDVSRQHVKPDLIMKIMVSQGLQ